MRWWTKRLQVDLERTIQGAVDEGHTPGAVICVGTAEKILFIKAANLHLSPKLSCKNRQFVRLGWDFGGVLARFDGVFVPIEFR